MRRVSPTAAELARWNAKRPSLRESLGRVGMAALSIAGLALGLWVITAFGRLIGYESTVAWWFSAYFVVGAVIATLGALAIFGFAWWAAAERWGGFCFVFGWLPAAILAFVSWWIIVPLWAVLLIAWAVLL